MRKLNNKGYLIVELILASVLAMTIAYFLLNLVVKLSKKNQDLYVETVLLTDKAIITNTIMDDVNKYTLVSVDKHDDYKVDFTYKDSGGNEIEKTLQIEEDGEVPKKIIYGDFTKEINENIAYSSITMEFLEGKIGISTIDDSSEDIVTNGTRPGEGYSKINDSILHLKIEMKTLYSDIDYGVNLVIQYNKDSLKMEPYINVKEIYRSGVNVKKGENLPSNDILDYFDYFPNTPSCDVTNLSDITNDTGEENVTCTEEYNSIKIEATVKFNVTENVPPSMQLTCDNLGAKSGTPDFSKTATTKEGVFKIEDGDEISCYYRGVADNYLSFGDSLYRIVRINGDGTIRIIKDDVLGEESSFNSSAGHNAYVGFMIPQIIYTDILTKYEETHKNDKNSIIKNSLENWYKENIIKKNLETYVNIYNNYYCNDRSIYKGECRGILTGCEYSAYNRIINIKKPALNCSANDIFSKVGLLTADEVSLAGGVYNEANDKYYLYNEKYNKKPFWTMTPANYMTCGANVFLVTENGSLSYVVSDSTGVGVSCDGDVDDEYYVRPVITLKKGNTFTGSGTSTDPYVLSVN